MFGDDCVVIPRRAGLQAMHGFIFEPLLGSTSLVSRSVKRKGPRRWRPRRWGLIVFFIFSVWITVWEHGIRWDLTWHLWRRGGMDLEFAKKLLIFQLAMELNMKSASNTSDLSTYHRAPPPPQPARWSSC